jgi:uncharacterized integral membrane protein
MKTLRRILVVALFGAAFVAAYRLAGANSDPVSVDLLFMRTPLAELWIVLLAAFGAGALAAAAVLLIELARLGLLARRYRRTLTGLETEIHQLRNLPITADDEVAAELAGSAGIGTPGHRG